MTYNYCRNLINTLSFHQHNVRFCTTLNMGELISTYEETPKELAYKIKETREKIRNNLINGIIPTHCLNCIYKNNEYITQDKITKIDLFYWFHCNCSCFYCSYRDETKGEFSDKEKIGNPIIYDTIKELYRLNEINTEELDVNVGGGELGVLKEFPKLIDLFLENNVKTVFCESSGIKYSKAVEKLLRKGKGCITVAVCSGTPETYKKIKRRDKYRQVMKNLKKYVNAAKKDKNAPDNIYNVVSKYIILENCNNNLTEVKKWLSESQKCGIKHVEVSMEFCWGTKSKKGQKIEDYNYEIFKYVENECKNLGLLLRENKTSKALMEKGGY